MTMYYGGVEAGGTKFICAVGTGFGEILAETRFPTTTPNETLEKVIQFFKEQLQKVTLSAIGIGSFGPVDLNPASPAYGFITSTPKPGWPNTDFAGTVRRALDLPVVFDTDVNAAALGEYVWGAAQGLHNFIYLTIGTGIGGGLMINRHLVHGLIHPEMGHLLIPHNREVDPYPGYCPFHGDCLEGLASGPAIKARWGQPAEDLPPDHPAWDLESGYLASALANLIYAVSPERIILGGGVMEAPGLLDSTRQKTKAALNGYIKSPAILEHMDSYLVAPGLGRQAGVLGAIALGREG